LIKERKKEVKQKKREHVKQEQASPTKKADAKQKKNKATANAQTDKRQEKMSKNRGLPVMQPSKKLLDKEKKSANGKAAKKLQRKKNKPIAAVTAGRKVTSPTAKLQPQQPMEKEKKNGSSSPPLKTKKQQQKTPTLSPKQQPKKTMPFVAKPTKNGRAVIKPIKGKTLQITLVRSKSALRRTKKQTQLEKKQLSVLPPSKKQKLAAKSAKALLPGKAQPKTRKVLAQTIVKKAKTASRKQWTSKNGKFTVRKSVIVRKA
jgi:hypothetical protein